MKRAAPDGLAIKKHVSKEHAASLFSVKFLPLHYGVIPRDYTMNNRLNALDKCMFGIALP
jgi:hypothetical protein